MTVYSFVRQCPITSALALFPLPGAQLLLLPWLGWRRSPSRLLAEERVMQGSPSEAVLLQQQRKYSALWPQIRKKPLK